MARSSGLNHHHLKFLRDLILWDGAATSAELTCQTTQTENAARQLCKRRGLVIREDGYWKITAAGREIIQKPQGEN
jgi:hypothetical protein